MLNVGFPGTIDKFLARFPSCDSYNLSRIVVVVVVVAASCFYCCFLLLFICMVVAVCTTCQMSSASCQHRHWWNAVVTSRCPLSSDDRSWQCQTSFVSPQEHWPAWDKCLLFQQTPQSHCIVQKWFNGHLWLLMLTGRVSHQGRLHELNHWCAEWKTSE